jgi:3-phosphoshikimate 1-carboxyvinyltransferase
MSGSRAETAHSISFSPCRQVQGDIRVPGDKSISHRALLVGALGQGPMEIEGLADSGDVGSSLRAVEVLGCDIEGQAEGEGRRGSGSTSTSQRKILLSGGWQSFQSPSKDIDVGNSGTTIRFLLGMLAGTKIDAVLTGDASIRSRPMERVATPLRLMGAEIETTDGLAPVRVRGRPLRGIDYALPVASAQLKSAILLAGLLAEGSTSVQEPRQSRDHTERMLRYLGAQIDQSGNRLIVKSTKLSNAPISVPGDLSSAAFFLAAAAILPGSAITVRDVGVNPTRAGFLDILRAYGADVRIENQRELCGEPRATVHVKAGDRRAIHVGGELALRAIDELTLIAILGALAEGETIVTDAAELRVKESDRVGTMAAGLRALDVSVQTTSDGFVVRGPQKVRGGEADSAGDHRIAMALAVAALAADGPTTITGWDATAVSYPGFEHDLLGLVR